VDRRARSLEGPSREGGPGRRPDAHHARGDQTPDRLRSRGCRRDRQRLPRRPALHPRALCNHVRWAALDHPAVRRLLHRGGEQRLLPPQPRGGTEGAVRRLRPRHPPRLRQRPSARCRRRRQGGRGDRQRRGHEAAVRRHPARRDERQHDHERRGDPDH
ncbi:MAG: Methylmalonyl-CoA mutase / B12 binding domain of Methylmalonyl-CoA mutase, partial [uncultured Sphingomonas sp.]